MKFKLHAIDQQLEDTIVNSNLPAMNKPSTTPSWSTKCKAMHARRSNANTVWQAFNSIIRQYPLRHTRWEIKIQFDFWGACLMDSCTKKGSWLIIARSQCLSSNANWSGGSMGHGRSAPPCRPYACGGYWGRTTAGRAWYLITSLACACKALSGHSWREAIIYRTSLLCTHVGLISISRKSELGNTWKPPPG